MMTHAVTIFACFFFLGDPSGLLLKHRVEIHDAAKACGISARLLASVVYAERSQNLRTGEDIVDVVLARCGYNSSVGVAQVKVETVIWLQKYLSDPTSPAYLGPEGSRILPGCSDRGTIVDSLVEPRTNLRFAAAYIAAIQHCWADALGVMNTPAERAGLVATLYSLGLEHGDGSMRTPHAGAKPNRFGETAREFFDSFLMREEFAE